jgi:hypothetical protein
MTAMITPVTLSPAVVAGGPTKDGDSILHKPKAARIQCKGCAPPPSCMTWAEQRQGYDRLISSGLTEQVVKDMLPLCPRCVGRKLEEMGLQKWPNKRRPAHPATVTRRHST